MAAYTADGANENAHRPERKLGIESMPVALNASRSPGTPDKGDTARPDDAHESLFTSGDYVRQFEPESVANPFSRLYTRKRDAVISSITGSDRRVLDIGGGMGRIAIPLAQRHFVTLTDISTHMLELARPWESERLVLQQANARSLPFVDEAFDFVVCIDVLPHIERPQEAIGEARRVLRPGGTLVIDSTNSVPLWTLAYPRYLGRNPLRWVKTWRSGGVPPEWSARVWHMRRARFKSLLIGGGFDPISIRGFGPPGCPKWHLAVATRL